MPQLSQRFLVPLLVLAGAVSVSGCFPTLVPRDPGDGQRRRRGIDVSAPFLAFHGRADQMGDLAQRAAEFRMIAVDADPANGKFSQDNLKTLRADGRTIVLGIMNVGFCDRDQSYWRTASESVLPCAGNLRAQIGERAGRPRQVWMDPEDTEYQRLIGEYVAPRLEMAGVDGFLLDGLELLDHSIDDDEAPCDQECLSGGLALLAALRQEFPNLIIVMEGGLSRRVREARVDRVYEDHVERLRVTSLIDGVIGEEIYTPSYNARKEADLLAWKAAGIKVNGLPLAIITQDYVNSCDDASWAQLAWNASLSHGFTPAVSISPVRRARVCTWSFAHP